MGHRRPVPRQQDGVESAYQGDVLPWEHATHKEGDLTLNRVFASGNSSPFTIGVKVGWIWLEGRHLPQRSDMAHPIASHRVKHPIYSMGPVQVGITRTAVCVSEGLRLVFLARDRRLWLYPSLRLPEPAPRVDNSKENREALKVYADSVARWFADAVTPMPERSLVSEAVRRYGNIVRALVGQRCLDANARGVPRRPIDYAHGISEDWSEPDLVDPRAPDMKHALLVSLVLGLPEKTAVPLIELGAQIEHRIPIVSRDAALAVWHQGSVLLARLSSEWWNRSYLCDWTLAGSIDRLFRTEYARMLNKAWNRGVPLESTVGVGAPEVSSLAPPTGADSSLVEDDDALVDPETALRAGLTP